MWALLRELQLRRNSFDNLFNLERLWLTDSEVPFCGAHLFWGIPPALSLPSSNLTPKETITVVDKFPTTVCKQQETEFWTRFSITGHYRPVRWDSLPKM
ncbi:hypothetical protein JG687_00018111 [Phytophthora cactorum]|uniref:Uncharacterized protein n=1 Tax=Phytophthora cactorum TaxID=29920 RepID=A0A8T1TQN2_9STRA|nr:hypothetical protein JG687_00018111 [Phytophthora cactorum]